jgi:hypothetical protein
MVTNKPTINGVNLMALKKHELTMMDTILQSATIISGLVEQDVKQVTEKLKPMLDSFTAETQQKIILVITEGGVIKGELLDLKQDFVRTRFNTEKTMLSLKAKLNGVAIDIKIVKDNLKSSNEQVAEALSELHSIVSAMPVSMETHGHDDWPRIPGEMPKTLSLSKDSEDLVDPLPAEENDDDDDDEVGQTFETGGQLDATNLLDTTVGMSDEASVPIPDLVEKTVISLGDEPPIVT